MSKAFWIENLNPEQQEAALHDHGPMLILAGAGSGKTTVLVSRTGRLIDEKVADAKKICVLTFTNKAAMELKHRVTLKLGPTGKNVWGGTFHSFGLQILKQFYKEAKLPKGFGIMDQSDSQALVKELLKDFKMAEKEDFDSGKLLFLMSDWRSKGFVTADNEDPYTTAATWVMPRYEKRLHHFGVVDFDGLLLRPLEIFKNHPDIKERIQNAFTQIMVDEFQDTNKTQLQLVMELAEVHKNVTVVGDDDQSIYGWRGACIDNILKFPKLYDTCKVVRLERNYRSTSAILNLANAVIIKNEKRHGKTLKALVKSQLDIDAELKPELFIYENEDDEAEKVVDDIESQLKEGFNFKDVAILFRSNGQGALLEAELKRRQIPHKMSGGTGFFDRKEIKDILSYLRCSIRPNEVALRRIINTPARGLGDVTIDHLTTFSDEKKISFFDAMGKWKDAGVNETAGESMQTFLLQLSEMADYVLTGTTLPSAGQRLTEYMLKLGYKHHMEKLSKNLQAAAQKWRLVEILGNILDKFILRDGASVKTLRDFVDLMQLRDFEDDSEENKNSVQLLTLHACKGLEFQIVYLIGIEEEILPHRTLGSDISEERRLFYVGVTRARQKLILSRAKERKRFGKLITSAPSRFLLELPPSTYTEYPFGGRPVSTDQRASMLAELYKKIDANPNSLKN